MINTFILEGKLFKKTEVLETERGIKFMKVILECQRPYRNENGEYDKDLIEVELWRGIAEITDEAVSVGEILSIQGRIQGFMNENNFISYKFIGEKVSFLN